MVFKTTNAHKRSYDLKFGGNKKLVVLSGQLARLECRRIIRLVGFIDERWSLIS